MYKSDIQVALFSCSSIWQRLIFVLILICGNGPLMAQGKSERDKNWKPEQGKYYFTQAWSWSYIDQFNDGGYGKGEFTIYVDTLSGTFLLNHDTYGTTDDQADFIVATQNGVYITGMTDENGKKTLLIDTLETIGSSHSAKKSYDEEFNRTTKPTGEHKIYGANERKGPVINGERYKTTFDSPDTFSYDYLAKMNFSLLPIYNFNQRQAKARLPYTFSGALHMNYLLLETMYESDGKRISIILKNVANSKVSMDLAPYKK
jgi:hypothetical protein